MQHPNKPLRHPDTRSDRPAKTGYPSDEPKLINPLELDRLELQRIFELIDRVLPFEACLYHEILPLSLESRTLHLGMVTLTDVSALDYARKILSFLNYVLIPQVIPIEMQHRVLSQYLQFQEQSATVEEEPTVFFDSESIEQLRATLQSADSDTPVQASIARSQIDRETLIVESPEALEEWVWPLVTSAKTSGNTASNPAISEQFHGSIAEQTWQNRQAINDSTVIQRFETQTPSPQNPFPPQTLPDYILPTPGDALPILAIKTTYATSSPEVLQALDSTELLETLLGEVLAGGIGRLYFEHQQDSGRVLSSNSGILQSMVESLPIARFESLIWALKNLMRVHPEPVTEPLQVEIERWHDKNRLLLRLRLMPKWEADEFVGEEATLQILRGAALRFYQQQQSNQLRRDTILVAKNLQLKVKALQDRSSGKTDPVPPPGIAPIADEI